MKWKKFSEDLPKVGMLIDILYISRKLKIKPYRLCGDTFKNDDYFIIIRRE